MYRNRKIERCVVDFYKMLPNEIRHFTLDIKKVIAVLNRCTVVSYQDFAEQYNITVNDVIAECESEEGCAYKKGDNYLILYNDAPDILNARKTFSIAHELGHIKLGHMSVLESLGFFNSNHADEQFKTQADYFAANLICPLPLLAQLKPNTIYSIQKVFGFSREAAEIAFKNYIKYDKYYHIAWHNDILRMFEPQSGQLKHYMNLLDNVKEEKEPKEIPSVFSFRSLYDVLAFSPHTDEPEVKISRELFEELEDDWLYPAATGLSANDTADSGKPDDLMLDWLTRDY